MMKNCPCPFFDALTARLLPLGTAPVACPALTALREDAQSCCCLALILFLTCQSDDAPAFLAEMRQAVQAAYQSPAGD